MKTWREIRAESLARVSSWLSRAPAFAHMRSVRRKRAVGTLGFLGLTGLFYGIQPHVPKIVGIVFGVLLLAALGASALWLWKSAVKGHDHPTVKWLVAISHITAGITATVFARGRVASVLQLPVTDLDVAVAVLALPLYVAIWSLIIAILLTCVSVLRAGEAFYCWLIQEGSPKELALMVAEFVGALCWSACLGFAFWWMTGPPLRLAPLVKWAAYVGDFHEMRNYPGVNAGEKVILHENGIVSTACIGPQGFVTTTWKWEERLAGKQFPCPPSAKIP